MLFATTAMMLALCNCSGSPFIGMYAADYRQTEAYSGDAQLLQNILRAKDNLPIHFADLSMIHGSLLLSSGVTAAIPTSGSPTIVSPSLGAQSLPTFDVGTLDTKEFTRGMLSPVDPKIVKQLFDQGVDPRLMLFLFFAEFQFGNQRFTNTLSCDHSTAGAHPERGCFSQIYDYLSRIDHIVQGKPQLQANLYRALAPIGDRLEGSWTMERLSELRQIDVAKYRFKNKQLYSISDPILNLCYEDHHHREPLIPSVLGRLACNQDEVIVRRPSDLLSFRIRSTYQIIQFLGQLLRFQEEKGDNRCVTLGNDNRHCDTGEVLFQVNASVGAPVVVTRYGDRTYGIYDRPCNKLQNESCDYSLQVLAIVELLLNANKSSQDILSTPRVSIVP